MRWNHNEQQTLLLKVALQTDHTVAESWFNSLDKNGFDSFHFREGAGGLLPIAAQRLEQLNPTHPTIGRLRGMYRRTWLRNQLALNMTATIVRNMQVQNFQPLLLNDLAISHLFYHDMGLRNCIHITLLVPDERLSQAVQIITDLGWELVSRRWRVSRAQDALVRFKKGKHNLRLYQRPLSKVKQSTYNAWIQDCREWEIHDTKIAVAPPTLQRLLTIGLITNFLPPPPINYVADAVWSLRDISEADWRALLDLAGEYGYQEECKDVLGNLVKAELMPMPAFAEKSLE